MLVYGEPNIAAAVVSTWGIYGTNHGAVPGTVEPLQALTQLEETHGIFQKSSSLDGSGSSAVFTSGGNSSIMALKLGKNATSL